MERLTTQEREEVEQLSKKLLGASSVWQKSVKKGVLKVKVDPTTKEAILSGGRPIYQAVWYTEKQALEELRESDKKLEELMKKIEEDKKARAIEKEVRKMADEASGRAGEIG